MTDHQQHVDEVLDIGHRLEADSVGRTLSLVGERWTIMILREAFFGVRRYGQFARNLNIPRPTLSLRLRKLVDAGLFDRVLYSTDPDRHEYRLTQAGRDLFPAVVALMRWGDTYLAGPQGPPIVLRHETCGKHTRPHLTCDQCGEEINTRNVRPERGPGFADGPLIPGKRRNGRQP
ncbi:MAG: putative transcriptional regulatory protein [Solirubrobacterales bacterium]|jgi:DNA-binding HxlR family transcriptional regulator|nr:putative transcriptional regulatory protein [Solirubrobacterales bacterium]